MVWLAWGCTLGCQDPIASGGRWVPLGAGVSLGWRALGGTLGCHRPHGVGGHWVPLGSFELEGMGMHPWVLGTPWGGWVLGTFECWVPLGWRALGCTLGCQGPYGVGGHWAAPLGTRDALGVGGHWAPVGAGGPYGWVGSGISLGGRWAAPLGAGTHMDQAGIGCPQELGLPMGQKALGRTLSPAPYGGVLGAPMGAGVPLSSIPPCSAPWRTS